MEEYLKKKLGDLGGDASDSGSGDGESSITDGVDDGDDASGDGEEDTLSSPTEGIDGASEGSGDGAGEAKSESNAYRSGSKKNGKKHGKHHGGKKDKDHKKKRAGHAERVTGGQQDAAYDEYM